jgi:hypothetical protein
VSDSDKVRQERAEKAGLVADWAERVRALDLDNQVKFVDSEPLGAAVAGLDRQGRKRLIKVIEDLADMVCDPRIVPKRPEARNLPVQVVLDIDPDVKPYQGGVARTFSPDKAAVIIEQLETLLAGGLVERIMIRPGSTVSCWPRSPTVGGGSRSTIDR